MLAIDTLKLAQDLKASGFDEKQTDGLVDLGRTLSDHALKQLATKEDIKDLRNELAALEYRMTIRLGVLIAGGIGLLVVLDQVLPRLGGG